MTFAAPNNDQHCKIEKKKKREKKKKKETGNLITLACLGAMIFGGLIIQRRPPEAKLQIVEETNYKRSWRLLEIEVSPGNCFLGSIQL